MSEIVNVLVCLVLIECFLGVFGIINTYLNYKFFEHRMALDKKEEERREKAYLAWLDSLGEKK